MNHTTPIRLRIPQPDLKEFSRFELDEEAAAGWSHSLPMANTRLAAQQLRHVLNDLNRVQVNPGLRFRILEVIRPNLLIALSNLNKRFINQPLIVPEEPRQLAELADTLNGLASTAYAMVAVHTVQQPRAAQGANPARLVCEAIHRALYFSGRNILQALQLYQPVEPGQWITLHQLFALAERQQLTRLPVSDPLVGDCTIVCAYLQPLLLSCCKPNQLRQSDLSGIYSGLRQWSKFAQIEPAKASTGLFAVDLASDAPPGYRGNRSGEPGEQERCIRTEALVEHLSALRQQCHRLAKPGIQFDDDSGVPLNILEHMIWSLGTMSQRDFARIGADSTLWIAIGLGSAHYHLAGGRTFTRLLYGQDYPAAEPDSREENPFLPRPSDDAMREQATDADRAHTTELVEGYIVTEDAGVTDADFGNGHDLSPEQRYPVHCVRMLNASPAGYGLEWPSELSGNLKTGNIVCVREGNSEDWSIAAVRWVNQPQQGRTVVGVELLSPGAQPYGAIIHQKTGAEGLPMRVLLLPEIKLVGQPHTLITPRVGFKESQKVSLVRAGDEFLIQLQRQVAVTGSFARFDFRYIKQLEEVVAGDGSGPLDFAYDSVWSKI
jgi:hypothetical protein